MRKRLTLYAFIVTVLLIGVALSIQARDKGGKVLEAYSFNTKDIAPEVGGVGGHIEMQVMLDGDGKIRDIEILSHNETPDYVPRIIESGFLEQFKGRGAGEEFIVGKDIDAVTGATVSSKAVAEILKTCLDRINERTESKPEETKTNAMDLESLEEAGLKPQEAKYYRVIE
ncbi:MAG: FMN-binding protein [Candidatus Omnitrophica bacterium]|nr:FMN-binding protein [Candidatus Omnitrophota bacterium]